MGWVGQGQHLLWWCILLCKIRNSETKKERFKNPPAFLPRPLLRAGRKPRRGNSFPPKKNFPPPSPNYFSGFSSKKVRTSIKKHCFIYALLSRTLLFF